MVNIYCSSFHLEMETVVSNIMYLCDVIVAHRSFYVSMLFVVEFTIFGTWDNINFSTEKKNGF